ncbi:WD40 repeat domain-containing protein [Thalassomonas actiniarum]|uniref:WD40 repeat domain-containing protein n=1 Tax=Thalassomonas actiniarum TaxID=485447 RepID=UPI000AAAEEAA|nr:hypothetical protein [Thalassomonas actiniarum]
MLIKVLWVFAVFSLFGCSQQEVHTGQSSLALHHSDKIITASALSQDGAFNLVADGSQLCLWKNLEAKSPLNCLQGAQAQFVELLDISKNNQFYLVSNRVSVSLFSLVKHQLLAQWQFGENIINDLDISAQGDIILLGFRSGKAAVIDVKKNSVSIFDKHRLDINSVSLSDNGAIAFTGSSDKKALLWQSKSGKTLHAFDHGSRVNHVTLSGDASIAFTLDAIKDRTFWDLSSGEVLAQLDTYLKFIEFNDALFSPDNATLLSGSPRQVLQLWRVFDGALLGQWQSAVTRGRSSVLSVAYAGKGLIATTNSDGLFEQWPLPELVTKSLTEN